MLLSVSGHSAGMRTDCARGEVILGRKVTRGISGRGGRSFGFGTVAREDISDVFTGLEGAGGRGRTALPLEERDFKT